jgi:hypothetical protein
VASPIKPTFLNLPVEVRMQALRYLPPSDLNQVRLTGNGQLLVETTDHVDWAARYRSEFGRELPATRPQNHPQLEYRAAEREALLDRRSVLEGQIRRTRADREAALNQPRGWGRRDPFDDFGGGPSWGLAAGNCTRPPSSFKRMVHDGPGWEFEDARIQMMDADLRGLQNQIARIDERLTRF